MNTIPAQEFKRRGIAAVDDCIAKGDVPGFFSVRDALEVVDLFFKDN